MVLEYTQNKDAQENDPYQQWVADIKKMNTCVTEITNDKARVEIFHDFGDISFGPKRPLLVILDETTLAPKEVFYDAGDGTTRQANFRDGKWHDLHD